MDEGVHEAEGPHREQHDEIDDPAAPARGAAAKQTDQRPEQGEGADEQSAGDQPRREIGPLHVEARAVGEIAEQRAQEQRKRKGEKDRVKRMERSQRTGGGYGDHGVSSRSSSRPRDLRPAKMSMSQRLIGR